MAEDGITVVTADGRDFLEDFENLNESMFLAIAAGISAAMGQAALYATQRHMVMTRGVSGALGAPIHPTKLTWRSADLARSILDKFTFKATKLPKAGKVAAIKRPRTLAGGGTGRKEGYRTIEKKANAIIGEQGTRVPYAHVHEFGSITHPERPFMDPAAQDIQREFVGFIEVELNKATKTLGYA